MRDENRYPLEIPIHYTLEEEPEEFQDVLKNISEGGICFTTDEYIDVATEIELKLSIGATITEFSGITVWCKTNEDNTELFDVGVQFSPESLEDAEIIVQQVCEINALKKDIELSEEREITFNEAVQEFNAENTQRGQ